MLPLSPSSRVKLTVGVPTQGPSDRATAGGKNKSGSTSRRAHKAETAGGKNKAGSTSRRAHKAETAGGKNKSGSTSRRAHKAETAGGKNKSGSTSRRAHKAETAGGKNKAGSTSRRAHKAETAGGKNKSGSTSRGPDPTYETGKAKLDRQKAAAELRARTRTVAAVNGRADAVAKRTVAANWSLSPFKGGDESASPQPRTPVGHTVTPDHRSPAAPRSATPLARCLATFTTHTPQRTTRAGTPPAGGPRRTMVRTPTVNVDLGEVCGKCESVRQLDVGCVSDEATRPQPKAAVPLRTFLDEAAAISVEACRRLQSRLEVSDITTCMEFRKLMTGLRAVVGPDE